MAQPTGTGLGRSAFMLNLDGASQNKGSPSPLDPLTAPVENLVKAVKADPSLAGPVSDALLKDGQLSKLSAFQRAANPIAPSDYNNRIRTQQTMIDPVGGKAFMASERAAGPDNDAQRVLESVTVNLSDYSSNRAERFDRRDNIDDFLKTGHTDHRMDTVTVQGNRIPVEQLDRGVNFLSAANGMVTFEANGTQVSMDEQEYRDWNGMAGSGLMSDEAYASILNNDNHANIYARVALAPLELTARGWVFAAVDAATEYSETGRISPLCALEAVPAFGKIPGISKIGKTPGISELKASGVGAAARTFLSVDDFVKLPRTGTIDPKLIRFSQDNASATFRPPYGPVDDLANGLGKAIDPASIKPIRIVEKDGMIFTLDNRRLYAFQKADIEIPYQKLDAVPKSQLFKFTTVNDGTSILIRKSGN